MDIRKIKMNQTQMASYMANPRSFTIKKWLMDLLKERYVENDLIIERLSTAIVTSKDLEDFGKLVGHIYEVGYKKAVIEHQQQLENLGYNVSIVSKSQTDKTS